MVSSAVLPFSRARPTDADENSDAESGTDDEDDEAEEPEAEEPEDWLRGVSLDSC